MKLLKDAGNPLQYSCLENSKDGGAWWAAVYGVAQSRTRLKQLSRDTKKENRLGRLLSFMSKFKCNILFVSES